MNKLKRLILCCVLVVVYSGICAAEDSSGQLNLISETLKAGAFLYWDPMSASGMIEKNGHSLSFRIDDQVAMIDNSRLLLVEPPKKQNGTIIVSPGFMSHARDFFAESESYYRVGAILIDAGHGGKDPGAIAEHIIGGKKVLVQEKDVVLEVSKLLAEKLRIAYPDKKIMLTRSDDRFLSLEQRVEIANTLPVGDHEAVLNISVHANASLDGKASGFEVWYLNPGYRRTVLDKSAVAETQVSTELFSIFNTMMEEEYTAESILIAKYILDGLSGTIGKYSTARGIKEEEWFVVRNAHMPSVLIELGFVTNQKEAELLNDRVHLNRIAEGIYNGLESFVAHFEKSGGFTDIR